MVDSIVLMQKIVNLFNQHHTGKMLTDAVLFVFYLGHQAEIPSFWTKALGTIVVLVLALITISVLFMFTRALFTTRQLISLSDKSQTVLGKPLLFPVNFMHMRMSPVKDKFSNRFLLIGAPVGLRCRVGNLLGIDDSSLDVSLPPGGGDKSVWIRMISHLSCWFSFDAVRLLHRGDHGADLREKLDNFLQSQVCFTLQDLDRTKLTRNRMKTPRSGRTLTH